MAVPPTVKRPTTPGTQATQATQAAGSDPTSGWDTIAPSGAVTAKIQPVYPPSITNPQKNAQGQTVTITGVVAPPTAPDAAPGAPADPGAGQPGTASYDLWRVNEILRTYGMDGWQVAPGTQPIPLSKQVRNPEWSNTGVPSIDTQRNAGKQEYVNVPTGEYVIAAFNPQTNEVRKLTMARVEGLDGAGQKTGQYGYGLLGAESTIPKDKSTQGYSNVTIYHTTSGDQMWGIRNSDNALVQITDGPELQQTARGWNSLQQIEMEDGSKVWWGVPPEGGAPKPVPNMPVVKPVTSHTSTRQVKVGNKLVLWGQNSQTGVWEAVPGYPAEDAPQTLPPSVTSGQNIYVLGPDGKTFVPAPGISQPTSGDERWRDGGDGYIRRETYNGHDWDLDPNTAPRPFSADAQRAAGALKPKGTPYDVLIGGKLVPVIADGNGGYDPDPSRSARAMPGLADSTLVATSTDQEFITRYNPETGQYTTEKNPNWQPKGSADQIRSLQDAATAKQAELRAKIGKNGYTPADADRDYDLYWTSTVEPKMSEIRQAQQQETLEANLKVRSENRAVDTQQANLLTAGAAYGQNLVANQVLQNKNSLGPNYGDFVSGMSSAIRSGSQAPQMDIANYTFQAPDLNELAQYGVAQYLQHVSPTAAAIASGQQQPQYLQQVAAGVDPNQILNRTRFMPTAVPSGVSLAQPAQVVTGAGTVPTQATPVASGFVRAPGSPAVAPVNLTPYQNNWGMDEMLGKFAYPGLPG